MSKKSEQVRFAADTAIKRLIRVRKEDSAFIYCVLEANEGICSYSTVNYVTGSAHRDLELQIPLGFEQEVENLLVHLGDLVYDINNGNQSSAL